MLTLKTEPKTAPRPIGPVRIAFQCLLVIVMAALVLKYWGQTSLNYYEDDLRARGEAFEPQMLWPRLSTNSVTFSNQLQDVAQQLQGSLSKYSGQLSPMVSVGPGLCRRGSQEPRPPRFQNDDRSNSWQELGELAQESQPSFAVLHALMKNPPSGINYDVMNNLEKNWIYNYVSVRVAAQALQASAMNRLHQGDLTGALRDLKALLSFAKLYDDDPSLVNFMIRMAVTGLGVDVCWDALQADGWTEAQLAELQDASVDSRWLLNQMPRAMEAERARRLFEYGWFRKHSYEAWIARHQAEFASFGRQLPAADTDPAIRTWRQYGFHPLWTVVCADEEEIEYLRQEQVDIAVVREGAREHSLLQMNEDLACHHQEYIPSILAYCFYEQLPLLDDFLTDSNTNASAPKYPYPDFSRAFKMAMVNLTLHEMTATAIAIKRYELSHGKPPPNLTCLAPAYMSHVPVDFMDGRNLRYRPGTDNTFVLYSVGPDFIDDHGNAEPVAKDARGANPARPAPWNGRDLVWPRLAPPANVKQVARVAADTTGLSQK